MRRLASPRLLAIQRLVVSVENHRAAIAASDARVAALQAEADEIEARYRAASLKVARCRLLLVLCARLARGGRHA